MVGGWQSVTVPDRQGVGLGFIISLVPCFYAFHFEIKLKQVESSGAGRWSLHFVHPNIQLEQSVGGWHAE